MWAFETSKLNPNDTSSPARSYFLILPKHFYYLETKHSNMSQWDHSHSNYHKCLMKKNVKLSRTLDLFIYVDPAHLLSKT